jgi:hypothetical protein
MKKPLFRWTVGATTDLGINILHHSIRMATRIYRGTFDWMVCYNKLSPSQLNKLEKIARRYNVLLHEQRWEVCPLPTEPRTYATSSNGYKTGGSFWKVCPPRMRRETHEIIMDNDVVLTKKMPQIEAFLSSDTAMVLSEPIRYFGKYGDYMPEEKAYNSGLMGLPPRYNFQKAIRQTWKRCESVTQLKQCDEQGLLTCALTSSFPNFIEITKFDIVELHPKAICSTLYTPYAAHTKTHKKFKKTLKTIKYQNVKILNSSITTDKGHIQCYGFHFVRSNHMRHKGWELFWERHKIQGLL